VYIGGRSNIILHSIQKISHVSPKERRNFPQNRRKRLKYPPSLDIFGITSQNPRKYLKHSFPLAEFSLSGKRAYCTLDPRAYVGLLLVLPE
jgi:hypothetical protein